MTSGIRRVIYPVGRADQSQGSVETLLGRVPTMDEPYYVQFIVGDQEIGLDPHGHGKGMTGPLGYWHVEGITESVKRLLDAGAAERPAIDDVGGRPADRRGG